ncbi:MAG: DotA/TraY family protein, partial [Gammaproteobacteria bacterium]|nr:DotA/TraY family protein [Gammaproteobacteria bacterium]
MRQITATLKRFLWFGLLFLPQLAFADSIPGVPGGGFNAFTPTPGDWSIQFLRQIFGEVGGSAVLSGPSQTIISKLFGVFNFGMLSLISVVIIYVIIKTVIDVASLGEVLGRKISHWTAVRTAFGVGLLVPVKLGGYSYIQVVIMWAVIQGVGLADNAWTTAVEYLQQGGVIYTTPAQTEKATELMLPLVDSLVKPSSSTPSSASSQGSVAIGATDVLSSLSCMHVLDRTINRELATQKQQFINQPRNAPKDPAKYRALMSKLSRPVKLQVGYIDTNQSGDPVWKVIIPYITQDNNPVLYNKIQQFNGACGVYSWKAPVFPASNKNDETQVTTEYITAKKTGIQQMVLTLDPAAQQLVEQAYDDAQVINLDSAVTNVNSAAQTYQNVIYPVASYAAQLESASDQLQSKRIVASGWAAAARYYRQMSQVSLPGLNSNYNKVSYQILVANIYPPAAKSNGYDDARRYSSLQNVDQLIDKYSSSSIDTEKLNEILAQVNTIRQQAIDKAAAQNSVDLGEALNMPTLVQSRFFRSQHHISGFDVSSAILAGHVNNVLDVWYNYMV